MGLRSVSYLFVSLIFIGMPLFAAEQPLPPTPPGFRIGMEMELSIKPFAAISGYFDFESLQDKMGSYINSKLPDDYFDTYLRDSPGALAELPENIRHSLTEGLELQSSVIQKTQPLVTSDGKYLASQPKIILPGAPQQPITPQRLILPGNSTPQPLAPATEAKLELPKTTAWNTLNARWKALDPSLKKSLVKWERLSPLHKSELALVYALGKVEIKKDLPPAEKRLFDRLYWSKDGNGVLEFRHREDLIVTDPQEFLRDAKDLATRAGVERKIFNPGDSRINTASFHYHISLKGGIPKEVGIALNDLSLIRRLNVGILNDLTGEGEYLYYPSATDKGHVRIYDDTRLEFRTHIIPLEEELAFNLRALGQNKDQAIELIHSEIRHLMSDYVVDKISGIDSRYLPYFSKFMSPEQKLKIQPKLELVRYMKNLPSPITQDQWEQLPHWLSNTDIQIRNMAISLMERRFDVPWPADFWSHMPSLLQNSPPEMINLLTRCISRQKNWPPEIWQMVPGFLRDQDWSNQFAIQKGIKSQKSWPMEFWKEIPGLLLEENKDISTLLLSAMDRQPVWPQEFWDQVPDLIKKSGNQNVREVLASRTKQPVTPMSRGACMMQEFLGRFF